MDTNTLLYLINILELIAAILATIHFKKYFFSTERYFFHFLWLTIFIELSGFAWGRYIKTSNIWIYNIYTVISIIFYLLWYKSIIKRIIYRRVITIFTFIFITVSLYGFIYESWKSYHSYTFICGAIFTVLCAWLYFSELLNSNKVLQVKHTLRFWISTGLLLFNVGMIPFMLFSSYFNAYHNYRNVILICLNVILYTCYSLGFIWTREENNQYS